MDERRRSKRGRRRLQREVLVGEALSEDTQTTCVIKLIATLIIAETIIVNIQVIIAIRIITIIIMIIIITYHIYIYIYTHTRGSALRRYSDYLWYI